METPASNTPPRQLSGRHAWHRNPDIKSMSLSHSAEHARHASLAPYPGPRGVMFRYPSSCEMVCTATFSASANGDSALVSTQ